MVSVSELYLLQPILTTQNPKISLRSRYRRHDQMAALVERMLDLHKRLAAE